MDNFPPLSPNAYGPLSPLTRNMILCYRNEMTSRIKTDITAMSGEATSAYLRACMNGHTVLSREDASDVMHSGNTTPRKKGK